LHHGCDTCSKVNRAEKARIERQQFPRPEWTDELWQKESQPGEEKDHDFHQGEKAQQGGDLEIRLCGHGDFLW
jgi:hypothetical protein